MLPYRILDLPENPLNNLPLVIEKNKFRTNQTDDPYSIIEPNILKRDIISRFSDLGLDIEFVVVFKTYMIPYGGIKSRMIHSDIHCNGNQWRSIPFAVNWEIGPNKLGLFRWYNMDLCEKIYPPEHQKNSPKFSRLSGIHYQQWRNNGIPVDAVEIASTYTNRPLLVRTDLPHLVLYRGLGRMAMSLRFKQDLTWDEAVERLDSMVVKVGFEPTTITV